MPLLVGVLVGGDKGVVAWCKIGNEADGGSEKGGCLVTDGMLSCATTTHFKLIVYTAEASHSRTVEQKSIASTAVLFQMERYISRSVSFSLSAQIKIGVKKILLHEYHLKRVRRGGWVVKWFSRTETWSEWVVTCHYVIVFIVWLKILGGSFRNKWK